MDQKSILYVLDKLPTTQITPGAGNTYCTCPLARHTHPKGKDSDPSMSIKVSPGEDSVVCCWSAHCGFRGTLTSLVSYLSHLEMGKYDDLLDEVRQLERADLDARLSAAVGQHEKRFEERKEVFYDERELAPYMGSIPRYILDRGFALDTCKEWELGFDKKKRRLVVPVRDTESRLVGMMGRTVFSDVKPKWWAYWHFLKSKYLYGENKLSYDNGEPERVIVVEGMLDVLWLWQLGLRNIVSIQGSKLSEDQVQRLLDIGLPVYLMFDGDLSGKEGADKAGYQLRGKLQPYLCSCPDGSDPGDLTREVADSILEAAEFIF